MMLEGNIALVIIAGIIVYWSAKGLLYMVDAARDEWDRRRMWPEYRRRVLQENIREICMAMTEDDSDLLRVAFAETVAEYRRL